MKGSYWTPEQDALLADLWGRGKSATECAASLPGKTRNSCIGRAHRLHLDHGTARSGPVANLGAMSKATRLARHNAARRAKRAADGKIPRPAPPTLPVAFPEPVRADVGRLSILELTPDTCRWPVGDVQSPSFGYCGDQVEEGCVYCSPHVDRAYNGKPQRGAPPKPMVREASRFYNN